MSSRDEAGSSNRREEGSNAGCLALQSGEEVTSRNLGVPGTYREIFNLLARGNVIDKELASDLSNLVYQRNILAHEYHNLTEKDVFRTYRRVYVIRKFVEQVKEHIKDV